MTLRVHPDQARSAGPREVVQVAVGILLRKNDAGLLECFLTTRPESKAYAGYWEFAGGKLEEGESIAQALKREFYEELGLVISLEDVQVWRSQRVDYPHALVDLHFCQIWRWSGEPKMLEGQEGAWQTLPPTVHPILPGALPVLEWLEQE